MASAFEVLIMSKQSFQDNKPTAMLTLTANQAVASGTNTQISWSSAIYDNWLGWSAGSPTRWTVPVAGYYRLDTNVQWTTGNATALRDIQLYYNGALINNSVGNWTTVPNAGTFTQMAGPVHQKANVGDFFQVNAFQSSGSSLNVGTTSTFLIEFLHY